MTENTSPAPCTTTGPVGVPYPRGGYRITSGTEGVAQACECATCGRTFSDPIGDDGKPTTHTYADHFIRA